MKKMLVMLSVLCIAALVIGCGSAASAPGFDKSELLLSEYSGAEISQDIRIEMDDSFSGQEEVTLTYTNLTDLDYTYTALQRLEVELDGEWYMVPDAQAFVTMQILTLPANASVEDSFRIEGRYDPLPGGTYRIVKCFVASDGTNVLAALTFKV